MSQRVRENPVTFTTSDGEEFRSKQEAERHEALVSAKEQYEKAKKAFAVLLAKTQKTADGIPFEFGWHRYYYIRNPHWSMPTLEDISISEWDPPFSIHGDDLYIWKAAGNGDISRDFRVSNLYRDRKAATAAYIAEAEKWLAERAEELRQTKVAAEKMA